MKTMQQTGRLCGSDQAAAWLTASCVDEFGHLEGGMGACHVTKHGIRLAAVASSAYPSKTKISN